jgi:hypothetical protein
VVHPATAILVNQLVTQPRRGAGHPNEEVAMKILSAAAIAATVLTTGLTVGAGPAAAAVRCGCPVVHHHPVRRHAVVYRHDYAPPPREEIAYREAPPPEPVYDEEVDYGPPVFGGWPVYYGGPAWYGGGRYYGGGGHWGGGWSHGGRGWGGERRGGHWR